MKKHFNEQASLVCDSCDKCYKCVKSCPVNAITIKDTNIVESDTLCIDCGTCYKVCHKNIHSAPFSPQDLEHYLISNNVVALLDSTYFMNLSNCKINQIESALLKAGFKAVETAFDGLTVHDYLIDMTYEDTKNFYFNSNCIPFVKYVNKFYPELTDKLLPYMTATEISATLKKEKYGEEYKILLVTDCFGDFNFTDNASPIDHALLSLELHKYLEYKNIAFSDFKLDNTTRKEFKIKHFSTFAESVISGMDSCTNVLDYASKAEVSISSPLRFFICSGSCFNLPASTDDLKPFEREQIYTKFLKENFIFEDLMADDINIFGDLSRFKRTYKNNGVDIVIHSEHAINSVLENGIGITKDMPEYNCNSCGYGSCREFAIAILNSRANNKQCAAYINRLNESQSQEMEKMLNELNEAFSLTIPDNRLEKKLKNTPSYVGLYDATSDYIEITDVIDDGLYIHIINCLKLAADLKDYNVFDLIGIDKNLIVQTILYHSNAKTQPILCKGDVVKYSDCFEDKKEEAARSAIFAKKYYNVSDDIFNIIKYHKHDEYEIPVDFPKRLLYVFRLFKIIDSTSSVLTKARNSIDLKFDFKDFILYIYKTKNKVTTKYTVDLYRKQDFKSFESFLKS